MGHGDERVRNFFFYSWLRRVSHDEYMVEVKLKRGFAGIMSELLLLCDVAGIVNLFINKRHSLLILMMKLELSLTSGIYWPGDGQG